MDKKKIIEILKDGGIGVLPTDTLYGIVGSAFSREAVERIYDARWRSPKKAFIILISSVQDLKLFGIAETSAEAKIAQKYWPGKVSALLPCDNPELEYLHRGTKMLAFRVPDVVAMPRFLEILKAVGPLVAPSANTEGKPPALTIPEAREYFGDKVDFYEDVGRLESEPSTLIKITGSEVSVIRQGAVLI